ncbi:MAG: hypothetical protein A2383_00540 [Candidatus Pacebacteria bacterium RIFOXYB1_FULL_39_46]|nr:MAG: hypothetical protein A2182_00370 [Candidatus Pacebacteria bacterium RIFOXYA1_FULL_38_18]OGJ38075.1 MAG: hypothetical protein A2383_00540 [Candidatus Pacebacteria bacterium RIFOXYB1_FULL_39_46]OGJ39702.1 MAG: hypothetical protein A2411_02905 [Candidatus Pacebacteria bacterium RIFOXYC1_FULL_39_21]OGJ39827.1 MAG: hypothetical protein A2582_00305 [Candidatus Pacebacteria bacterium RIFOXYD1_FULL_39_27]
MTFFTFAQHLKKIEAVSARLEITRLLSQLFSELKIKEIPPAIYLSLGRLVPQYQSLEFQLSTKMILRALTKHLAHHPDIYGANGSMSNLFNETDESLYEERVNKLYKQTGDIGETTEQLLSLGDKEGLKPDLLEVYEQLVQIAKEGGTGSQERKIAGLIDLFEKLDSNSLRFIVRIIVGKLRLGFSTMTVLDALSWTKHNDKSESGKLEELFQKKADLGLLAQVYLDPQHNLKAVQKLYQISEGIPVMPALCQRLNSAEEIIAKMPKVIVEPKYDGLRIQIHLGKDKNSKKWVRSFTRNLEETSQMFPELNQALTKLDCVSCILDGEVVGVDKKTGKIVAFQETSTRRRKHGIAAKAEELPVRFYLFDVLEKNGQSLIDTPLSERKTILKQIVKADTDVFTTAPFIVTSDPEELHDYHTKQLALGLEGAVIKKHDSVYKSGRKGWRWVKIKEEEGTSGKLSDTLDCIVMGYYGGRGKRAAFGVGAFLVGLLGDDGKIYTLAKIGTGLTDEQFKELKKRLNKHEVKVKPKVYKVHKNLIPDGWIEPSFVVEIAADELTRSPVHSAGKALRFPRLVKFRDDKTWQEATTLKEMETIKIG